MKIGTKSVLFGAHCFFIHPWIIAAAWWKLFGFPWDPRLWVAFMVHDIGYWSKPNMDGEEGEHHPFTGAAIMGWLFDYDRWDSSWFAETIGRLVAKIWKGVPDWPATKRIMTWYCFCFYHSRFLSKRYEVQPSMLCVADKLAICMMPAWLYIPMTTWTGEIYEYMKLSEKKEGRKYREMHLPAEDKKHWYEAMQKYVRGWVEEHKDGKEDTWTPKQEVNV